MPPPLAARCPRDGHVRRCPPRDPPGRRLAGRPRIQRRPTGPTTATRTDRAPHPGSSRPAVAANQRELASPGYRAPLPAAAPTRGRSTRNRVPGLPRAGGKARGQRPPAAAPATRDAPVTGTATGISGATGANRATGTNGTATRPAAASKVIVHQEATRAATTGQTVTPPGATPAVTPRTAVTAPIALPASVIRLAATSGPPPRRTATASPRTATLATTTPHGPAA